jgi:hypothetical protein
MGGDLKPRPAGDKAPSFAVWAVKDPTSGNLDRIQIIKGWTKSGQSFEKVFDVAWAGDREPDTITIMKHAIRKSSILATALACAASFTVATNMAQASRSQFVSNEIDVGVICWPSSLTSFDQGRDVASFRSSVQ